jgi:hypothetical protein
MQSMWAWSMMVMWLAVAFLAGGIWTWSKSARRGARSRDVGRKFSANDTRAAESTTPPIGECSRG